MNKPILGKQHKDVALDGQRYKPLPIDLDRLIATRLLLQANSGGGKSYALRRILEQTHGQVQQIVIDIEGEFSTLREKFDYILCAPHDADAIVHPRSAKLLARKLREIRVSAIVDIYDLKAHERFAFVRDFLQQLLNSPKKYWTPALVVIDEAHLFAPEKGKAETTASVVDIATRGRKRGLGLLAATQRLSKLNKDVAAELLNKVIGRTGLDIDVTRAADELGMTKKEAMITLRTLNEGEFYCFGPALSQTVTKIKVGEVTSKHPTAGERYTIDPPKPSAKIKKVLPQLSDLPQEAEQELKTLEQHKARIADLLRELRAARAAGKAGMISQRDADRLVVEATVALNKEKKALVENREQLIFENKHCKKYFEDAEKFYHKKLRPALDEFFNVISLGGSMVHTNEDGSNIHGSVFQMPGQRKAQDRLPGITKISATSIDEREQIGRETLLESSPSKADDIDRGKTKLSVINNGQELTLSGPQKRLIDKLAALEIMLLGSTIHKNTLAGFAGVSPKSGTYANNLSKLKVAGLLDYPQAGYVKLTEIGRNIADPQRKPPTLEELHESWLSLVSGPQRRILRILLNHYPTPLPKARIAELCEVSPNSGTFANNLSKLRTLKAIDYPRKGFAVATEFLFPEGLR